MNIEAVWTGRWPNLCHGEWKLIIDGVDYSNRIPKTLRDKPMHTRKKYSYWHFAENYEEIWEDKIEGLTFLEWVNENPWIHDIPAPAETIYYAFQAQDWQYGTCGGCI